MSEEQEISSKGTFDENLDLLSEKRGSVREGALESLTKELRMNYDIESLEKNKLTMFEALKKGLRKGGPKEQELSSTVLSLMFLTLGGESEELYKEISPILEEIMNKSEGPAKPSLMSAYAMTSFIGNTDEAITLTHLSYIYNVISSLTTQNDLLSSALKSYALLLTVISKTYTLEHLVPEKINTFVGLLNSEDMEVRIAAGDCIALLFEAARTVRDEDFDLNDFCEDNGIVSDDLVDTLYSLTTDKTKARAKKDKSKQRVPFKEIKEYVEEGTVPVESLVFKHQKYEFDNWSQIIQVDAIRELLSEGLQTHFENNGLIHEIFDVILDKNKKKKYLSSLEKRMFLSPSSPIKKANTKSMNKQRLVKERMEALSLDE